MPTSLASGTQATSIATEHDLATSTAGASFVLVVDCAAMAMGDVVELRLYTKCLSGGTERLAYLRYFANTQGEPMKYSVPVPANIHLRATLKQTAGTGRNFAWNLLSI